MSIHLFVRAGVSTESTTQAAPNPTALQKTHTQPSPRRGLRIIWRDAMRQVPSFKSGPLTELEIVEKLPRLHNW